MFITSVFAEVQPFECTWRHEVVAIHLSAIETHEANAVGFGDTKRPVEERRVQNLLIEIICTAVRVQHVAVSVILALVLEIAQVGTQLW